MTTAEILKLSKPQMKPFLLKLAEEYRQLTGRDVCLTCWGDINFMITTLKNEQMSKVNFRFKNEFGIYKMKPGSPETVTQAHLTDEKAIEYIKINPERISLFMSYPENWRQLVGLADEKEAQAHDHDHDDDCCEDEEEEPCAPCLTAALEKQTYLLLKKQYSNDVPWKVGTKKDDYIKQIVAYKLANS